MQGLSTREARLARDLQDLCHPPANWVPPSRQNGEAVTDAVIVGGGMCGLVAWLALSRAGIRNVRIIHRSPEGQEGP